MASLTGSRGWWTWLQHGPNFSAIQLSQTETLWDGQVVIFDMLFLLHFCLLTYQTNTKWQMQKSVELVGNSPDKGWNLWSLIYFHLRLSKVGVATNDLAYIRILLRLWCNRSLSREMEYKLCLSRPALKVSGISWLEERPFMTLWYD